MCSNPLKIHMNLYELCISIWAKYQASLFCPFFFVINSSEYLCCLLSIILCTALCILCMYIYIYLYVHKSIIYIYIYMYYTLLNEINWYITILSREARDSAITASTTAATATTMLSPSPPFPPPPPPPPPPTSPTHTSAVNNNKQSLIHYE